MFVTSISFNIYIILQKYFPGNVMIKNNLNKLYSLIKYKSTNVLSNLGNIGKYIEDATKFVNTSNLTSTTNYLIWVDTKNFKTNKQKKPTK